MIDDDDPFAEPGDTDRTVIKPNPAGRRTAMRAAEAAPTPQAAPYDVRPTAPQAPPPTAVDEAAIGLAMTGMNQLNASAATLFSLISRIRNRAQHLDPADLRRSVIAEIREFEARTQKLGIDPKLIKLARYAISATIDDVVLNTPWGGESIWATQTMVGTFHKETVGGDRFYDLLKKLEGDHSTDVSLLEFMYMCLALGFEGRLRVDTRGSEKHAQIRASLAQQIRQRRGVVETGLSPHWKGLAREVRNVSLWTPVWVSLAALSLVLGLVYLGLSWSLASASENVRGQLSVVEAGVTPKLDRRAPPPPPPPPLEEEDNVGAKIAAFLKPEIDQGLVNVIDDVNTVAVRIIGQGMFPSGSDQLASRYVETVIRVGNAMNPERGPIIVAGHSDNIPISTARFPSNAHLSLARAKSVQRTLMLSVQDGERMTAEGRAARQPIASNDTPEGRARNRRIEIVLVKQSGE